MATILMDAAKEAERIVLSSGKGLGAAVERAQMQRAASELRKLSSEMWGGPITATMKKGMEAAAVAAVNSETFVNDVLGKAMGARFEALEQAFAFDAKQKVLNLRAKEANDIPLSDQVYKSQALSNGWVQQEVKRAIVLGQSASQLADRVRNLISPNTPGGVSYAANRLARTEINNAFHRAQIDRRKDEPWTTGMKWNISGSHPKPDECNDYGEKSHFKDGEVGVFKPDQVPGKPHPNCLCYLTTVTIGEDEFIENFLKGDYSEYMDSQIYSSGIGTVC